MTLRFATEVAKMAGLTAISSTPRLPGSTLNTLVASALQSFDEFENYLGVLFQASDQPAQICSWHGRHAATFARRAGACDHLITAALVHDFSVHVGFGSAANAGGNSAKLLSDVFPDQVLIPLRMLDISAKTTASDDQDQSLRIGTSQSVRLHRYIRMAHLHLVEKPLQLDSLLRIARRASLEG